MASIVSVPGVSVMVFANTILAKPLVNFVLNFTTSFETSELITGVIVSLIIAAFTDRIFSCCGMKVLRPHKIIYFIQYFFVFIIALIKSNFDVAKRVISPDLPINPGIVKFKTKLTNGFARMVLANTITLTPGTLTIDAIGNTFYRYELIIYNRFYTYDHRTRIYHDPICKRSAIW